MGWKERIRLLRQDKFGLFCAAVMAILTLAAFAFGGTRADADARATLALVLAAQAVSKPAPAPAVKTCECSQECVCGCNEGSGCRCGEARAGVPAILSGDVHHIQGTAVPAGARGTTAPPPTTFRYSGASRGNC